MEMSDEQKAQQQQQKQQPQFLSEPEINQLIDRAVLSPTLSESSSILSPTSSETSSSTGSTTGSSSESEEKYSTLSSGDGNDEKREKERSEDKTQLLEEPEQQELASPPPLTTDQENRIDENASGFINRNIQQRNGNEIDYRQFKSIGDVERLGFSLILPVSYNPQQRSEMKKLLSVIKSERLARLMIYAIFNNRVNGGGLPMVRYVFDLFPGVGITSVVFRAVFKDFAERGKFQQQKQQQQQKLIGMDFMKHKYSFEKEYQQNINQSITFLPIKDSLPITFESLGLQEDNGSDQIINHIRVDTDIGYDNTTNNQYDMIIININWDEWEYHMYLIKRLIAILFFDSSRRAVIGFTSPSPYMIYYAFQGWSPTPDSIALAMTLAVVPGDDICLACIHLQGSLFDLGIFGINQPVIIETSNMPFSHSAAIIKLRSSSGRVERSKTTTTTTTPTTTTKKTVRFDIPTVITATKVTGIGEAFFDQETSGRVSSLPITIDPKFKFYGCWNFNDLKGYPTTEGPSATTSDGRTLIVIRKTTKKNGSSSQFTKAITYSRYRYALSYTNACIMMQDVLLILGGHPSFLKTDDLAIEFNPALGSATAAIIQYFKEIKFAYNRAEADYQQINEVLRYNLNLLSPDLALKDDTYIFRSTTDYDLIRKAKYIHINFDWTPEDVSKPFPMSRIRSAVTEKQIQQMRIDYEAKIQRYKDAIEDRHLQLFEFIKFLHTEPALLPEGNIIRVLSFALFNVSKSYLTRTQNFYTEDFTARFLKYMEIGSTGRLPENIAIAVHKLGLLSIIYVIVNPFSSHQLESWLSKPGHADFVFKY